MACSRNRETRRGQCRHAPSAGAPASSAMISTPSSRSHPSRSSLKVRAASAVASTSQPGAAMIFHGPRARPAAHDHAGDQQGQPRRGRPPDLLRPISTCRRGHHQLQAVLRRPLAVEEQDVLGAGADVDGEDLHGYVARPVRFMIAAR